MARRDKRVKGSDSGAVIPAGRRIFLALVLAVGFATILGRAAELQLLENEFLQDQGDARFLREVAIDAYRGPIVDRNGDPLAVTTPVESIWSNPGKLLNSGRSLTDLARLLGLKTEELAGRLAQRSDRQFVYLRRHSHPELAAQVRDLELPGVGFETEYRRFYPTAEISGHLLGFTDIDDSGQEGLELAFDSFLSGAPGAKRVIRSLRGEIVENVEQIEAPRPGGELTLSIDRRLQYLAYRELKSAILENQARSGSLVVLDAVSGEVLAMVNQPAFNPNTRRAGAASKRNRAVTDMYEPGSVIKPFTVVAALESGQFNRQTVIPTSPGTLIVADHLVRDFRDYGDLDLTGILVKSSNVGATRLALGLRPEHLVSTYQRFGFGQVSGSGFPGESPGLLPVRENWREIELATLSYGYGLSVTVLQLAQAYAALANDGRMRPPTFVKGQPNPDKAVVDPHIARAVLSMLEAVVSPTGTGHRAMIPGYRVAGKTGTSRKVGEDGYQKRYVATFAGIAPVSDPRIVTVVSINDPAGEAYYGGQLAAPVFARITSAALRLMNVPADAPIELNPELQVAEAMPGAAEPGTG